MATATTVNMQRQSINQPWGMKICGGRDFRMQLQVKKVDANSPAAGFVNNGDAIIAIGGTSAESLTHMQAHQLIKSAGNHLQLTVLQGHFKDIQGLKPKGPVKFSPWRSKQQ
ncbi:PDZ and LIM domain protein 4-like [Dreissena polymorpha]|uniref:PDZ domain-containing protein n=1 Tax=Dreissena polymorpha TaxID=45954 RepID=A0A9D4NEX3_DREPO|nr:PDZ and LIM domain protein 4-like [Dreissena polymorpha]KAH3894170.1 hypothetical protein DPMN_018328 [Dreissena polymorpha]